LLSVFGLTAARPPRQSLQLLQHLQLIETHTTLFNAVHQHNLPAPSALLQVLLLSDDGLSTASPQGSPLQPLKLTDTDPLLAHLALESAAYWQGLQLLAGSQLLSPQASCDVVLQPDRDHAGAEGFSKLQVRQPSAVLCLLFCATADGAVPLQHSSIKHDQRRHLGSSGWMRLHLWNVAAAVRHSIVGTL
jgi:hypothetical protein